ncbi:MAG: tyrosinase family protein [Nostoc sp.]|uniref:tyrosinase family protein n=1 Tax=Nostoc sp. TaxID=1180 RepID=UPI002FF6AEEA
MADPNLQQKLDKILSGQKQQNPLRMAEAREAQSVGKPMFSAFVDQHVSQASELAQRFIVIADERGLPAAVDAIGEAFQTESIAGLVQYAVKLFLTHHPEARSKIKLKPLESRQPNLVRPSRTLEQKRENIAPTESATPPVRSVGGAIPPEDQLEFWREDPLINEHHEHWHLVYPTTPFPPVSGSKPDGGYTLGDRHGELFAYMHEQMLARYDAERLAVDLPRVQPFDVNPLTVQKFTDQIPQGYDPGQLQLWDGEQWYQFRARPAGATLSDLTGDFASRPGAKIADQVGFGNGFFTATTQNKYLLLNPPSPVTIDNLGNTVEANRNSVDYYGNPDPKNFNLYGNIHNDGHIHFMLFDNQTPYGVMSGTATAVRDPIFFRWHKLIDDIYYSYQQTLPPYDFSQEDSDVKVKLRKDSSPDGKAISMDIILSLDNGLPAAIADHKFGTRAYNTAAAAAFGGDNWDTDFSSSTVTLPSGEMIATTDELLTEMLTRKINLESSDGHKEEFEIEYLSHEDFYYFIRLQNNLVQPQTVAVRVFLAPENHIEDPRLWIEMDKFAYSLKANERAVIFRPADQASVVRKPALKPDDLTDDDGASAAREAQPWCDCGWPYTMLLPRGTGEGMEFRLLVMCSSSYKLTLPDHPECCTSISYCGLQDLKYPDDTAMGYPFDRQFSQSITKTVQQFDHWAWRTIKIRYKNLLS